MNPMNNPTVEENSQTVYQLKMQLLHPFQDFHFEEARGRSVVTQFEFEFSASAHDGVKTEEAPPLHEMPFLRKRAPPSMTLLDRRGRRRRPFHFCGHNDKSFSYLLNLSKLYTIHWCIFHIVMRWEKYLPMGRPIAGTRFLPFKVPLKTELCKSQPENTWFTPNILLENTPMLKAVIDLTNTNRYYNSEEFTSRGVYYKKINIFGGGRIPPRKIRDEFFDAVDQLCRMLDHDSDALIGVHCTHGLNRTGYLICKYMVLRMKIDPQEAINKFQEARGYSIERENYVSDIMSEESISNWRTEHRSSHYSRSERYCSRDRHFSRLRVGDYSYYSRHSRRTLYKY